MDFTSQPYSGEADFARMQALLVEAGPVAPQQSYMYPGDLTWWAYQNTITDPYKNVRIWEGPDAALLGFVWFDPPNTATVQVHPAFRGQHNHALEDDMLHWAEEHARGFEDKGEGPRTLKTWAREGDDGWIAFLESIGYKRGSFNMLHMARDLVGEIPAPLLPEGWTVRPVDETELQARVDLHREVWHPSKVTLDAYRRLRQAPGYRPDLDIVAVAPDGTLASYCICWVDQANASGDFEPVGTRSAYRGQGIGKAVMYGGLRRLQEHGASHAYLFSLPTNLAAFRLYESVGFRVLNRDWDYTREL